MKVRNLIFTFFLVLPINTALAEDSRSCIVPGDHDAVTFLLVDRTDKLEHVQNLRDSLTALNQRIAPGERLIVGISTDKASDARILIDVVKPKKSLWVSKLKIRAGDNAFEKCFSDMTESVLTQDESYKSSAILETLSFVSKALLADKSPNHRLVIFSDMMQNSEAVSFYRSKPFTPDPYLKLVEKEYLVWDLKDTSVSVAGAGTGISDKQARAVEVFWKKYFEMTGAHLEYFGPILLVNS